MVVFWMLTEKEKARRVKEGKPGRPCTPPGWGRPSGALWIVLA
jgi:hypothetical protein